MVKPILFLFCLVGALSAASSAGPLGDLVTFPYAENPCSCGLRSCTCCTGISVPKVGLKKNLCVLVSVALLSSDITITIKLDSKTLTTFTFPPSSPPTYCVPIAMPFKIAMCLKIHDVSMIGLTGVQMCMTLYGAFNNNNVVIPLHCIRMASGSMQYYKTSSTSSTTSTTTSGTSRSTTPTATTTTSRTATTTTTPATTTATTTTAQRTTTTTTTPATTTTTTTTTPRTTTTTTTPATTTTTTTTTPRTTTTTTTPATTTTTTTTTPRTTTTTTTTPAPTTPAKKGKGKKDRYDYL